MGDEWKTPPDRGGRDPQVSVMKPLMERVAYQAAAVAKLRHGLGGLGVDLKNRHLADAPRKLANSSGAPARRERSVSRLSDRLRRHTDAAAGGVLGIQRLERRPTALERGREHIRVHDDARRQSSLSAA